MKVNLSLKGYDDTNQNLGCLLLFTRIRWYAVRIQTVSWRGYRVMQCWLRSPIWLTCLSKATMIPSQNSNCLEEATRICSDFVARSPGKTELQSHGVFLGFKLCLAEATQWLRSSVAPEKTASISRVLLQLCPGKIWDKIPRMIYFLIVCCFWWM